MDFKSADAKILRLRRRLSILSWLLLLSFSGYRASADVPEPSYGYLREYKSGLALYGEALFRDLKACHAEARRRTSPLASRIVDLTDSLNRREFETSEGQVFAPIEIWNRRALIEFLPISFLNWQILILRTAHLELATECSRIAPFKNGTTKFQNWFESINDVSVLAMGQSSLRVARWVPTSLIATALDQLPSSLRLKEPFLQEDWFKQFVVALLNDRVVQKHLLMFSRADTRRFQTILGQVFAFFQPTEIQYAGMVYDNPSFPFIPVLSQQFEKESIRVCLSRLSEETFQAPDTLRGRDYFSLVHQNVRRACQGLGLTAVDELSVLAAEDWTSRLSLPLSYMLALASKFQSFQTVQANQERKSILASTLEETHALLEWVAPAHQVIAWKTPAFMSRQMNHFDAPAFASCRFSKESDLALYKAAIFFAGVVYQIFDAEAGHRLRSAPAATIIEDALRDLHLWDQGIEYGCS